MGSKAPPPYTRAYRINMATSATRAITFTRWHCKIYTIDSAGNRQSADTNFPVNSAAVFNYPIGVTWVDVYAQPKPSPINSTDPSNPYTRLMLSDPNQSITSVSDWDSCNLQTIGFSAHKLTTFPTTLPRSIISLRSLIASNVFNQDISTWDTSNIVEMTSVFQSCRIFNKNISNWNVSNVRTMTNMFFYATAYNQPLNAWDVGNVTNMASMFEGCTNFNQPLNNWNTSKLINMAGMFNGASAFNQNLSGWNVSKVTSRAGYDTGATTWQAINKPIFT